MTNKYAVITGGSRGLGAALARHFWEAGYHVIAVSRHEQDQPAFVHDKPHKAHQTYTSLGCDLAQPDAVDGLCAKLKTLCPKLDVLINNAAIQGPIGPLQDNDLSAWQTTLQVNLLAPVALCQQLIDPLAKAGTGSIINLSGGGATGPRPYFSAYATAKTGLVRFSETLAEELKPSGIRVNCIAPGAMKTSMLEEVLAHGPAAGARERDSAQKVMTEGGASMERVAALALFLASDAARGISGKLISAVWDHWDIWPQHLDALAASDAYTLRRIIGKDRGLLWGDK